MMKIFLIGLYLVSLKNFFVELIKVFFKIKKISIIVLALFYHISLQAQSWELVGLQGSTITKIIHHPEDPKILYLNANYKILKSINGGVSWDTLRTIPGIIDLAISTNNPTVLYAINNTKICRTIDAGLTWVRVDSPTFNKIPWPHLNVIMVDPDDYQIAYLGITVDFFGGYHYVTYDGGNNWYPTWLGRSVLCITIDPFQSNILYSGGTYFILKSYDRGWNWEKTSFQYDVSIGKIYIDSFYPNRVYATSEWPWQMFISNDSGLTWTQYNSGLISSSIFHNIDLVLDPVWKGVAYLTGNGKVYVTIDNAESWQDMSYGLDSTTTIQKLAISPDGSWLYGGGNGLYRYRLATNIVSKHPTQSPKSDNCQNYPNPFNRTTCIEYYIPNPGIVHFSVYDLAGKKVFTHVTRHENFDVSQFTFNASHLTSGIYFYIIEGVEHILKGKMVVLK